MKIFLTLLLIFCTLFPQKTFAHGAGFPPFFKIDGKIAEPYFMQNVGIFSTSLNIPQDEAHKKYRVGDRINFEIDKKQLEVVFPPEVIDSMKFEWDFGDGRKGSGIKNTHKYEKIGSYILSIYMDTNEPDTESTLIESALIHVVPADSYSLPKPFIKVNGKDVSQLEFSILDIDLNNSLTFEASGSKSSAEIVSYIWDFGDEQTSGKKIAKHQYQLPQAFATVVLRATDENGFFTDSYINVRNSGKNDPNNPGSGVADKIIIFAPILMVFVLIGYRLAKPRKQ